jgi:hypothetical protein
MAKRDKDPGRKLTVGDVLDRTRIDKAKGVKQDAARGASDETPYLAEMIERSSQSGRPLEDVLVEDLRTVAADAIRTPECLHPSEVRQAMDLTLPAERRQHLMGCRWCQALVRIARPRPDK